MKMEKTDKTEMGDTTINISGGQQGAVGPGAQAHDFTQVSNKTETLGDGLGRLRAELERMPDKQPEHYMSLANVASAEKEAKAGNEAKAIDYLKKAGKLALDLATKIGVTVATEAVKGSLGL